MNKPPPGQFLLLTCRAALSSVYELIRKINCEQGHTETLERSPQRVFGEFFQIYVKNGMCDQWALRKGGEGGLLCGTVTNHSVDGVQTDGSRLRTKFMWTPFFTLVCVSDLSDNSIISCAVPLNFKISHTFPSVFQSNYHNKYFYLHYLGFFFFWHICHNSCLKFSIKQR